MTEIIAGIAAALGGIVVVLWKLWKRAAKQRDAIEADRDTRKRMQDAQSSLPNTPDAGREWLRKRGNQ